MTSEIPSGAGRRAKTGTRTEADTIVAIATPSGAGAVGIVRLSGPASGRILAELTGRLPKPRSATVLGVGDGTGRLLDRGLVLYFPAPNSYTGEDVVELHLHGGPRLLELVLEACQRHGARLAEPGEFTRRAFLNGKLDLVAAEAVADLIAAESAGEVYVAARQLEGRFRAVVEEAKGALLEVLSGLFAAADYPDDVAFEAQAIWPKLEAVRRHLAAVLEDGRRGRVVREGVEVVLAVPPNAGKSSLFNALVGYERAIVTAIPGTTRDTVREVLERGGIRFRFVDTAGLRHAEDPVEAEGVRRTREAVETADMVLWVAEATARDPEVAEEVRRRPHLVVAQKGDLVAKPPPWAEVVVSAKEGWGVEELWARLLAAFPRPGDVPTTNQRHLALLREAEALLRFRGDEPLDVVLSAVEAALDALMRLTGEAASEAILAEIFSRFCLGK